ncbi:MAG: type II toxin-antitoxin system VapC family toxin [Methylomonas sp.]|jgi:tRNA(fMet)-specific endonuclease VapC|uniref:type II toxin-antitoxin system VapC family toxin n=1 Tax=Methylomonas sp. TaxID=418 RepID=UPI0025FA07B4|nr:type II toxin-antitoxin system VapC family toxin [Methylomonas sp.]MCK9607459.1 type II toxin-antitoxin system VapC family toxin [Methylomonas sp.]
MYALDTNTVIYFFKGMGNVATHLFNVPPHEIAIPAVVLYELQVGIAKSNAPEKRSNQLNELLTVVSVLPFTAYETAITARIRVALEKAGTPIGPLDMMIAGIALANQATLVTHNTKEFSRIDGLRLEDWFN